MISDSILNPFPWFALYVKHKHEKHVGRLLTSKAFDAFVPTYSRVHRNGCSFELPLFPGYVFCRMDRSRPLPVISTPGVFGRISNGPDCGAIPEDEIEGIKQLLAAGLLIQPAAYFAPGREICLTSGPFKGIRGVVVDASHERWLIVSIHLLQRSIAAKIDRGSVLAWSQTSSQNISGAFLTP